MLLHEGQALLRVSVRYDDEHASVCQQTLYLRDWKQ
jgi:hypothetical protein